MDLQQFEPLLNYSARRLVCQFTALFAQHGRNLPEAKSGRWGEGLTAEKMKDCRWLKPVLVGQVEFVEWTPDGHLRHSSFVASREDRDPCDVRREA